VERPGRSLGRSLLVGSAADQRQGGDQAEHGAHGCLPDHRRGQHAPHDRAGRDETCRATRRRGTV
ncbi:MAG: hypothetical protein AVDCRST_MAG16-2226, partial [uncultured Frankineae bacterium]